MLRLLPLALIALSLGATERPLGHPAFEPGPERPVGWRGDGSGCYLGATPVTSWDLASGENIIWKAEVPYWGTASPIVVGDKVITTCEPFTLLAYDTADGELVWHASADHLDRLLGPRKAAAVRAEWIGAIEAGRDGRDKDLEKELLQYGLQSPYKRCQGHTFPTPVSDGRFVYTAWANNTATCFDVATGEVRWQAFFGPVVSSGNGFKTDTDQAQVGGFGERWVPSPVLADGVLVTLQGGVMHGLDAATGEERWRWHLKDHLQHWAAHDELVRRDGAQGHWGCGTPVLLDLDGTKVVVTSWGHCIRVADGATLSEYLGAMGDVAGASPVADDELDIVYFADYQDGGNGCTTDETWAVKLTASKEGVEGEVLWHHGDIGGTGGSMIAYRGLLIDHSFRVVDGRTGEKLGGAPRGFKGGGYNSPVLANGLLVHFRQNRGQVAALEKSGDGVSLRTVGGGELLPGDGGKKSPLKDRYEQMMIERAKAAVEAGTLPYVDHVKTHGSWADCYGSSPFLQGDRMYVRTRMGLYCIGPKR